jgi:hypothetical protein
MGLFAKLKEKSCEKELSQRVYELNSILQSVSDMKHSARLLLGDRLDRAELEISKSRGVPAVDVYSVTGPCWTQRGGIIGDARATSKRMMDRLSSRDEVTALDAYQTVIACDLLMILYRLAILEHGSQQNRTYCENVRGFVTELITALRYCTIHEMSEQYVEAVVQDFVWRLKGLPWNLRPASHPKMVVD